MVEFVFPETSVSLGLVVGLLLALALIAGVISVLILWQKNKRNTKSGNINYIGGP